MKKNVIDITDKICLFSLNSQKYGKLNFYKFDETEKQEKLDKILSENNKENDIIKTIFNKTFNPQKNKVKIEDIDLEKITDEEYKTFIKEFFNIQFYKYTFDYNLTIRENIEKALKYEEEQIREESIKLAERFNMKLESLTALGSSSLSTMAGLNTSIGRLLAKPEPITMPKIDFEPLINVPNPTLKHNIEIENLIKNLTNSQIQANNQSNEQIQNLSESLLNLITLINTLHEKQAIDSKKESDRANLLAKVAIGISIAALLFDIFFNIYSSKVNDKIIKNYEEKKIELIQTLSDNSKENVNQIKDYSNKLDSLITTINDNNDMISNSLSEITNTQNEINKEIKKIKQKGTGTK